MMATSDEDNQIFLNERPQQNDSTDDEEDFLMRHQAIMKGLGIKNNSSSNSNSSSRCDEDEQPPLFSFVTNELATQSVSERKNMKKKRASTKPHGLAILDQLLIQNKSQKNAHTTSSDTNSSQNDIQTELQSTQQSTVQPINVIDKSVNERKRTRQQMESDDTRSQSLCTNNNATRRKRRKKSKDPFHIDMPVAFGRSQRSQTHRVRSKNKKISNIRTQKAKSSSVRKRKRHKNKNVNDPFYIEMPLSISKNKISSLSNANASQIPSHYKKKKKKKKKVDNVEEIEQVNDDFLHTQTQESAFPRSNNESTLTLPLPPFIRQLEESLIASTRNKNKQSPNDEPIKKKKKKAKQIVAGPLQQQLEALNGTVRHRYNLVKTFKNCIGKIPANLGVNGMLNLKILKSMLSPKCSL